MAATEHRTLDLRRADRAYQAVLHVPEGSRAKYATYVKDLPIRLLKCGLGQTLAFLDSKRKGRSDSAEALVIRHVSSWVGHQIGMTPPAGAELPSPWLLDRLVVEGVPAETWHAAIAEAVAYATWLKRFCEALMPDRENDDPNLETD